jgi:hypothetical protein
MNWWYLIFDTVSEAGGVSIFSQLQSFAELSEILNRKSLVNIHPETVSRHPGTVQCSAKVFHWELNKSSCFSELVKKFRTQHFEAMRLLLTMLF